MKKNFCLFALQVLVFSCKNTNQNEVDLSKIKIGMNYSEVQAIMTNRFSRTFDGHKFNQTTPVFTHYYEAPFAASGDFEIWYNKKDSTVVNVYYGD